MKQIRWWNSFTLLGIILLITGTVGLILGSKMVFDPGRAQRGYEWALYLVAGALMMVNGFLPPITPASSPKERKVRE